MQMLIDLDEIGTGNIVDKRHRWGYQIRMVNRDEYAAKFLVLENGEKGSLHYHKQKTETFIVLSGKLCVLIGDDELVLIQGGWCTIRPGEKHQMWAIEFPALVLEVSTHDDDSDTYRLEVE